MCAIVADVLTLTVGDPAQTTGSDQIAPRIHEPHVARLFGQLIDESRSFCGQYDSPAVFHRVGGGYLRVDVLARFERLCRQRALLLATHCDRHRIDVLVCEEVFVVGIGRNGFIEQCLGRRVRGHDRIADGRDSTAFDPLEVSNPGETPVTDSDKTDSYRVALSHDDVPSAR